MQKQQVMPCHEQSVAIYDYHPSLASPTAAPSNNNEKYKSTSTKLSFNKGEFVVITAKHTNGWARGYVSSRPNSTSAAAATSAGGGRQKGWFPLSYVRIFAIDGVDNNGGPLSPNSVTADDGDLDERLDNSSNAIVFKQPQEAQVVKQTILFRDGSNHSIKQQQLKPQQSNTDQQQTLIRTPSGRAVNAFGKYTTNTDALEPTVILNHTNIYNSSGDGGTILRSNPDAITTLYRNPSATALNNTSLDKQAQPTITDTTTIITAEIINHYSTGNGGTNNGALPRRKSENNMGGGGQDEIEDADMLETLNRDWGRVKNSQQSTTSYSSLERQLQQQGSLNSNDGSQKGDGGDLPAHWHRTLTKEGREYFYNKLTNATVWNRQDVYRSATGESHHSVYTGFGLGNASSKSLMIGGGANTNNRITEKVSNSNIGISAASSAGGVVSWESLVKRVVSTTKELNDVVTCGEKYRLMTSTKALVMSVKLLLESADALEWTSPVLSRNKALQQYYLALIVALSQLALAAKEGASTWPPPDAKAKIQSCLAVVLKEFKAFVQEGQKLKILLKHVETPPMDTKKALPSLAPTEVYADSLSDEEMVSFIDSSASTVYESIDSASQALQKDGTLLSSTSEDLCEQVIRNAGNFASFLDEIRMDAVLEQVQHNASASPNRIKEITDAVGDQRSARVAMHNNITGLLASVTIAADAFAPPSAVRQILINLALILKSVGNVVVCTKSVLDLRGVCEREVLERQVKDVSTRSSVRGVGLRSIDEIVASGTLSKTASVASAPKSVGSADASMKKSPTVDSTASSLDNIEIHEVVSKKKISKFFGEASVPEAAIQKSAKVPIIEETGESDEFSPDDVIMTTDDTGKRVIKGATLTVLVNLLTAHNQYDTHLTSVFLATFHTFTTPEGFLAELQKRFEIQPPEVMAKQLNVNEWREKKLKPIRLRVFKVFKKWLEDNWYAPIDRPSLETIRKFIKNVLSKGLPKEAERLLEVCVKRETNDDSLISKSSTTGTLSTLPSSTSFSMPSKGRTSLISLPNALGGGSSIQNKAFTTIAKPTRVQDVDALDMAHHLTILEHKMFLAIHPMEFIEYKPLDNVGNRSSKSLLVPSIRSNQSSKSLLLPSPDRCKALRQIIAHSNSVTSWVAETILLEKDLKQRAWLIRHFVRIAQNCHSLGNYSTREAILAALNSTPIYRLKKTWESVPNKIKSALEALSKFMDREDNFLAYRQCLKAQEPPCIPFIGLYLTDVTFINQGNSDTLRNGRLINFAKCSMLAVVIEEILRLRMGSFAEISRLNQEVLDLINGQLKVMRPIQELHDLSLELEPRLKSLD